MKKNLESTEIVSGVNDNNHNETDNNDNTPTKLYSVHNHITNTESTMTQSELEASWPDLKSGTMEIVDEIYLSQL